MLWWVFAQAAAVLSPTFAATPEVTAPHAMVVASSGDRAADAGLELLKRGGTAMDAAMAVAMAQPCLDGGFNTGPRGSDTARMAYRIGKSMSVFDRKNGHLHERLEDHAYTAKTPVVDASRARGDHVLRQRV